MAGFRSSLRIARARGTEYFSTHDLETITDAATLQQTWLQNAAANGGTLTANTDQLVYDLATAVSAWSGFAKILYLLPLLGGNLASARVPLIDRISAGVAQNIGFTNADYSETTGLTGDGIGKRLDFAITSGAVMTAHGGLGLLYGLRTYGAQATPNLPLSIYHSSGHICFGFVMYSTMEQFISSGATPLTVPERGIYTSNSTQSLSDYYGQDTNGARSLELYRNGTPLAATTATWSAVRPYPELNLGLLGCSKGSGSWWSKDRVGSMVVTNGHLTATEVAELHTILQTHLYTPTGR